MSTSKPKIDSLTIDELRNRLLDSGKDQDCLERGTINLIASDNACPTSYLHDLPYRGYGITEGLVGDRPFAGSQFFDEMEAVGVEAACRLFGAEHANLQPPSCSQANQAVYQGLLKDDDRVLALDFRAGGHLTHGLRVNFSGRFFDFKFYGLDPTSGLIDYDNLAAVTKSWQPRLLVFGSSSYPRLVDFQRLRQIADSVGAYLMGDLSHEAGLVAGGALPQPFPHIDVMTCSLDKTLRGPHGGTILCKRSLAAAIDKGVHPGTVSSILMRRIFHAALALVDAHSESFREYTRRVIENAQGFVRQFSEHQNLMITGGTDTHMVILDTRKIFGLSGGDAERLLERAGILANRQVLPSDPQKIRESSGIRLGSAWISSRGYEISEAEHVAQCVLSLLTSPNDAEALERTSAEVRTLTSRRRVRDVWSE